MKSCHLIGNGPSKKDFINTENYEIFGCNLSSPELPLTASFIMDACVIEHILINKVKLNFPIIFPEPISRLLNECNPRPIVYAWNNRVCRNGESTGHHAAMWLAEHEYSEVNLWGFDSFKVDSVKSDSQDKMANSYACPTNYLKWRTLWDSIFKKYPETKFIIR